MDIVQNVFIKTFNRLADIRRDGNFKAWIAQVACRESIDGEMPFFKTSPISMEFDIC